MNSNDDILMLTGTAILVLGMHRSGTSATTRVLNLLGAELGANLLEAQADNAKGFWEHAEVVQIHEELLEALGRTWHDVRDMPEGWLQEPASYVAIDRLVKLIRRDFEGKSLWAVKDPRMCRLVPLWQATLQRVGVRATALIVLRKPEEVAGSMHAREGWSKAHSDLMWVQHSLEAVRFTEEMPRSMVTYDEVMADWQGTMRRVANDLSVTWPDMSPDTLAKVDTFLSPEDRHHHLDDDAVSGLQARGAGSISQQIWAAGVDISVGRAQWAVLSGLDERYLEMARLFGETVQQKYELDALALERIDHIRLVERELESVGRERDDARGLAGERASHLELLAAQHQQIIDLAGQRLERIQQLERMNEENDSKLQQLRDESDAILRQMGEGNEATLRGLRAELQQLQALADDLSQERDRQAKANETLSERCQELDGALRQEHELGLAASNDLDQLRQQYEKLSQAFSLTFHRRWLMRRIWELTIKGEALRDQSVL